MKQKEPLYFAGNSKIEKDLNKIILDNQIYFGKATVRQRNYLIKLLSAKTGENVDVLIDSLNKEQASKIIDYMDKLGSRSLRNCGCWVILILAFAVFIFVKLTES